MCTAKRTKLLKLKLLRSFSLVFSTCVVSLLAIRTTKRNDISHIIPNINFFSLIRIYSTGTKIFNKIGMSL